MQTSATSSGCSAFASTLGGVGTGRFRSSGVSHNPGKMIVVRIPLACSSFCSMSDLNS